MYVDLYGRRLVDSAIALVVGHLFLGQGAVDERKRAVAKRFVDREMLNLQANCAHVLAGDATPVADYDLLAGPVPSSA